MWAFEPTNKIADAGSNHGAMVSPAIASAKEELTSPKAGGFWMEGVCSGSVLAHDRVLAVNKLR